MCLFTKYLQIKTNTHTKEHECCGENVSILRIYENNHFEDSYTISYVIYYGENFQDIALIRHIKTYRQHV